MHQNTIDRVMDIKADTSIYFMKMIRFLTQMSYEKSDIIVICMYIPTTGVIATVNGADGIWDADNVNDTIPPIFAVVGTLLVVIVSETKR